MKIGIASRTDLLDQKTRIFINESYIHKIVSFGHSPILLYGCEDLEELASICDALIIPGGYDIPPYFFNSEYDENCTFYKDTTQDIRDFAILEAFVKKQKPILGICRGIQLINVYFKGTLHQHIDVQKHEKNHEHLLSVTANTFLASCMPAETIINSYHHQVLAKIGEHLQICATSKDGYVEAIQHDTLPIIAVQWHPELMKDDCIFPYFFTLIANFHV